MNQKTRLPDRQSIRLKGYDYAEPGAYFVTICIQDDSLRLDTPENRAIIERTWYDLPNHYPNVKLDQFVVMPNHVHGIVFLLDQERTGYEPAPTGAIGERTGYEPAPTGHARRYPLSEIIRGFKTYSARRLNDHRHTPGISVWQRNYYEHIVRNDIDLDEIRQYIANNPAKWDLDEYNPKRHRSAE